MRGELREKSFEIVGRCNSLAAMFADHTPVFIGVEAVREVFLVQVCMGQKGPDFSLWADSTSGIRHSASLSRK